MNISSRLHKWFEFPERRVLFVLGLIYSSSVNEYIMSVFMTFLTDIWNLNLKRATIIMNVQVGLKNILEIFVRFFIDAYLGDRWMLILSSIINVVGFSLLSLSVPRFFFKDEETCSAQEVICYAKLKASPFFIGLALIIVGGASQRIPLYRLWFFRTKLNPMPQDKTKIKKPKFPCCMFPVVAGERRNSKRVIRFLCITFMLAGVYTGIFGFTSFKTNWVPRFLVSAITIVLGLLLFLCGIPFYPPRKLQPCFLSTMLRVLVAAMRKRHLNYQSDEEEQTLTNRLTWLNKAAIIWSPTDDPIGEVRSWRDCTAEEVEQTKTLLGMIPMATTFIMYGVVKSVGDTFFIAQADKMDGKVKFGPIRSVPIPFFKIVSAIASSLVKVLYVKIFEKRINATNKRYSDGVKIGLGMLASTICCTVASFVEAKRLKTLRDHGLLNDPEAKAPMSVFWLLPQFFFMGVIDGLGSGGIQHFFRHNVPLPMRKYGPTFTRVLIGCGIILSIGFEALLDQYNKFKGRASWIASSINQSHLDYLYRAFAAMTILNLFFYAYIATRYSYQNVVRVEEEEDEEEEGVNQEVEEELVVIEVKEGEEEAAEEKQIIKRRSPAKNLC